MFKGFLIHWFFWQAGKIRKNAFRLGKQPETVPDAVKIKVKIKLIKNK